MLPRDYNFEGATVPTIASQMPRWHHSQMVCVGDKAYFTTERLANTWHSMQLEGF